eukprot:TRINITY_DN10096_c0_g1_i1.p1 TRINITY_DN10096_c0_g1~~TRINITY_DN10096_c0_g1_i1.p1  ORF type:complete len:51 (+),score=9.50 TRINITY_DN10096_c0_g1_i1:216-368(+)
MQNANDSIHVNPNIQEQVQKSPLEFQQQSKLKIYLEAPFSRFVNYLVWTV